MANPIYHDDPEWYERPGETVHLHVDEHATQFAGIALPYKTYHDPVPRYFGEVDRVVDPTPSPNAMTCQCCGRSCYHDLGDWRDRGYLCAFCSRAQQRDTTATVRHAQPKPTGPRISSTEPWEVGSRWD